MIFNLFKSKPTLKELIPDGFVDIHSHILPGIDDGAKDAEESLLLISKMNEMGFSKIIGTPHTYPGLYENCNETIIESYNKIKSKVLNVKVASEYMIGEYLFERLEKKDLLTLEGKSLLTELSFISEPLNMREMIFKIQINDYVPILAHPERYKFYYNDFRKYYTLKKLGYKFQINLLSVLGYYGKDVLKITDKLLSKNLVNFVGSDIHNKHQINYIKNPKNKVKLSFKSIEKLERAMNNNKIFG
tara:strand:+ start:46 stop:780 length:735 start_codon:yes stop_codon:yes gene_type:complete